MTAHGPLEECRNEDNTSLFPPLDLVSETGLVQSIVQHIGRSGAQDLGDRVKNFSDRLQSVKGAVCPSDEKDSTGKWVLEHYPDLACGFTGVKLIRKLQQRLGKLVVTSLSDDMKSHDFMPDGFGTQATEVAQVLVEASQFNSSINETLLHLHGMSGVAEKEIAALIIPHVQKFQELLSDAQTVHAAINKAGGQKAKTFLSKPSDECQGTFCPNFRKWSGIQARAERDVGQIAKEVLQRDIRAVGPSADRLLTAIQQIEAADSFLPVKVHADEARKIEVGARFYIAVANSLINLVVKPARKYPPDALKRDAKKNIIGLSKKGWWHMPEPTEEEVAMVAIVDQAKQVDVVAEAEKSQNYFSSDATICRISWWSVLRVRYKYSLVIWA